MRKMTFPEKLKPTSAVRLLWFSFILVPKVSYAASISSSFNHLMPR